MDLRRLEIFAKVAELGSFSRAAEALFLTQPTVSEHVRALEEELGVQLLDRLGRGATPTRAGQILLGYARRMLALSRETRQAIDQFQGRLSGELLVGGSTIPGEYVLPALIGQFKAKYPDISISLLIEDECRVSLVACVRVKDLKIWRAFYLVTHRERTRSPLAEAFLGFVESQSPGQAS